MRLVSYRHAGGQPRSAVVVARGEKDFIVDLEAASGGRLSANLRHLLGAGLRGMESVARLANEVDASVPVSTVTLLPPIWDPAKFLAVSDNYRAHLKEWSGTEQVARGVPKFFLKPASTLLAPGGTLHLPHLSDQVDWEVELTVVIGEGGRDISASAALDHVAGYTIAIDVSARRINWGEERDVSAWDEFFDWLNGKWFDGFGPLGPWLVTKDDVPDPDDLGLKLAVNGKTFQDGSRRDMTFGVEDLVAWASRIVTLEPGDLIATGTPPGVGLVHRTFLKPGDEVEATISGLGTLRILVDAPRE